MQSKTANQILTWSSASRCWATMARLSSATCSKRTDDHVTLPQMTATAQVLGITAVCTTATLQHDRRTSLAARESWQLHKHRFVRKVVGPGRLHGLAKVLLLYCKLKVTWPWTGSTAPRSTAGWPGKQAVLQLPFARLHRNSMAFITPLPMSAAQQAPSHHCMEAAEPSSSPWTPPVSAAQQSCWLPPSAPLRHDLPSAWPSSQGPGLSGLWP